VILLSEGEYPVRLIKSGDQPRIVDFLTSIYGRWPTFDIQCSSFDHWKWKHEDKPLSSSLVTLCEKDKEIVGVSHSSVINVKLGEELFTAGQSVDTAVHIDHRLKGIRTLLTEKRFEHFEERNIRFNLAVTGNPYLINSLERKKRPKFPHSILCYTRILDIEKHLKHIPMDNEWIIKAGFHALSFLNAINKQIRQVSHPRNIQVKQVEHFDNRVNKLWSILVDQYDYIGVRDKTYLNWRYCDQRAGDFRVTIATENDGVVGYIVSKVNRYNPEYPVGFIVDLMTLPDRTDVVNILLNQEREHFDSMDVNVVLCLMVKGHPYERILPLHGFLNSHVNYQTYIIPVGDHKEYTRIKDFTPDRTYYSWGDHDSLPLSVK